MQQTPLLSQIVAKLAAGLIVVEVWNEAHGVSFQEDKIKQWLPCPILKVSYTKTRATTVSSQTPPHKLI
jgi:hypothetical protein